MTSEHDTDAVRAELIDRIQRSWDKLNAAVDELDDGQLDAAGPDGWSVRDHLVHLERWEAYVVAELEGRDGRPELGLAEGAENPGTDVINDGIQRRYAATPVAEVRRQLNDTHARVTGLLRTVDGAVLEQHSKRIAGNTHEHLDEHTGWIRSLAAAPAS